MHLSIHRWEDDARSRRAAAALGLDDVQVWIATAPPAEADLSALACLLSPDERARADRFAVSEPRRQFVFGRALLRQLVGACATVDPVTLAFDRAPRGKPFLSQPVVNGDLRFNLSHSGRIVAIALARGRDVGVDIEAIACQGDWRLLAERIFSPRELRELHALPTRQQPQAFFDGWTRKEAYLKATGEGLTEALTAIEVTLAPGREPELLRVPAGTEGGSRWTLRVVPLPPGYAGTVAFEKSYRRGV